MGRQQQRRRREAQARQRRQSTRQPSQQPARRQPSRQRQGIGRWTVAAGVAVLLLAVAGIVYAGTRQGPSAPPTPVPATAQTLGQVVDGVQCGTMEQLAYHIHQHLALYDGGKAVQVPSEIGIPGGELNPLCYYWIHVHASTPDIIHVESPIHKTFTLGAFLDIWKATKTSTSPPGDAYVLRLQAAAARGQVHAFYNGKAWRGSYRSILLKSHAVITVEIGTPVVPPKPFSAWNGL